MYAIQQATTRELEVLSLLSEGKSAKEIASDLYISTHTVESHKRNLIEKINARNTLHMVVKAVRMGMVCVVMMLFSNSLSAQLSDEDESRLWRNLDSLHYGDAWYGTPYTDTLGQIWEDYKSASEDVFVDFFKGYFSQRHFTLNLTGYLWYPMYAWHDDNANLRVQRGVVSGLTILNKRLFESTPSDAALADSMQNNIIFRESLRELHQVFTTNFSRESTRFVDLVSRDSIINATIWTLENYFQFFQKPAIIDHALYPTLHSIRAQIYANLAAAVNVDPSIKSSVHDALQMDNLYSDLLEDIWNDHDILVIENSETDSSILRVFLNYLEKIPKELHEWIICNQTDDMNASIGKWYAGTTHYGKVRFNTPTIPQTTDYMFPQESQGALSERFTIDNVNEVGSSIYTKTIIRTNPELRIYLDSLLTRAGDDIDNYAYNRNHLENGYYKDEPAILFRDEFRMYMASSQAFFDLAIERWVDSRPHAISQLMLFANLFALNRDSTIFYRVDELGDWTSDKYEVEKDADGFITKIHIDNSCAYEFVLDADKMVTDIIYDMAICDDPPFECPAACANDTNYPDYCALMDFYDATNGPNWNNNDGWRDGYAGTDCNYCDWFGVTCDEDNRVIRFDLNYNNMGGIVPVSFGDLTKLEDVNFWDNNLYGELPQSFFDLTNLDWLNLGYNAFSGQLEDFCNLENVRNIGIPGNRYTGEIPSCVGSFTDLLYYNVSSNRLTGPIPEEFYSLDKLRRIDLDRNSLTGQISSSIGDMLQLEYIDLDANEFIGELPPDLGKLQKLIQFRADFNNFTGSVPDVFNMPRLEAFSVQHNNSLTGPLPKSIAASGRMKILQLNGNDFSGCIPYEYKHFCDAYPVNTYSFYNLDDNPNLSNDNWDDFCANSTGICDDITLLFPMSYDTLDNGCSDNQNAKNWLFKWYDGSSGEKLHLEIFNTQSNTIYWEDANLAPDGIENIVLSSSISDDLLNKLQWRMRSYSSGVWSGWTDYVSLNIEPPNTDCTGCTDAYSHNYSPYYEVSDGSCATCSDNILNGDEEGVDCGGSLCYPCEPDMCNTITLFGNGRLDIDLDDRTEQRSYNASYKNVYKVAIDTLGKRIFYIEGATGDIVVNYQNTGTSEVIYSYAYETKRFRSIVYHPTLDRLFVADELKGEILSISADGSSHEVFAQANVSYYTKLIVGPDDFIYWNDVSRESIIKADTTGSCIENWQNTIWDPEIYDIDFSSDRLYFGTRYSGILRVVDMNSNEVTQLQDYSFYMDDIAIDTDGNLIMIWGYPDYQLVKTDAQGELIEIILSNFYEAQILAIDQMIIYPGYRDLVTITPNYTSYYRLEDYYNYTRDIWNINGQFYELEYGKILSFTPQSNSAPIEICDSIYMRHIDYDPGDDLLIGLSFDSKLYTIDQTNCDTTFITQASEGYFIELVMDTVHNEVYVVNRISGESPITRILKIDYSGNQSEVWSRDYNDNVKIDHDPVNNRLFIAESYRGDYALSIVNDNDGSLIQNIDNPDRRYPYGLAYDALTDRLFLHNYQLLEQIQLNSGERSIFAQGPHINNSAGLYIHRPDTCDPCYNGVQDNGEEGIDCGGSCKPCEECENITEMLHGEIPDNTHMEIEHWVMTDGYVMPGSDIMLQAGDEITLMEGSEIAHGAVASYNIDPCTPPGIGSARSDRSTNKSLQNAVPNKVDRDQRRRDFLEIRKSELDYLYQEIEQLTEQDVDRTDERIIELERRIERVLKSSN
ncbi:UNVERIFIED_CONTAM: hypothetical protein GTU68_032846 [Idotea baltica]|nr:hypothetical protein [Idotea baltica]